MPLLRREHRTLAAQSRRPRVQPDQAAGEADQREAGQSRRDDGGEQQFTDRKLAGGQRLSEHLRVDFAKERVGAGRHLVQLTHGLLIGLEVAEAGIAAKAA
jgi:hypothetical protein